MSAVNHGARVRAAAARVVDGVASHGRSLDRELRRAEQDIRRDDRALLAMLAFGCVRHYWRLGAWIDALLDRPLAKKDGEIRALLAVGLLQLDGSRIPPHAAVSETVEATRVLRRPKYAGLVNAILRRFQRERATLGHEDEEARYDHPAWLIAAIRQDWSQDWQAILDANNERAPMWIRVNARRTDVDAYRRRLDALGTAASPVAWAEQALRLDQPVSVSDLPGHDDGDVSVQDAGAQLAAPWLLGGGDGRILDACAAPGGKSGHLGELAPDGSELTAIDVDPERVQTLASALERLDVTATVRAADASATEDWWDGRAFDRILLDAPCSASGVIRRHPDIKLLRRESDIGRFRERQVELLGKLWPLLAPGGRLLYVTCSVLSAENEAVVDGFLEGHDDARENDMLPNNNIRDLMRRRVRGYQLLPGTGGTDGFYFACLEKNA